MLSYRHGFHAGNYADVLKHSILIEIINEMNKGLEHYYYIDTHAGAGFYELNHAFSQKTEEFKTGIAKLWDKRDLPPMLDQYLSVIKKLNTNNELKFYPGSPVVAFKTMRAGDPMQLFELHSTDAKLLSENIEEMDEYVQMSQSDGFAGLTYILPPVTNKALVLIDPSYEIKKDYSVVYESVKDSLERFNSGTYVVWYPCLAHQPWLNMLDNLKKITEEHGQKWLNVQLNIKSDPSLSLTEDEKKNYGMYGTGLFIVNPPVTLHKTLKQTMQYLEEELKTEEEAKYILDNN